jgi:hypothetical protein
LVLNPVFKKHVVYIRNKSCIYKKNPCQKNLAFLRSLIVLVLPNPAFKNT